MFNFCDKSHIHISKKGRDYCNETGKSVSILERFLLGKPIPWNEDKNG